MQKEDKTGNDQADTGADRGAVAMQKVTQKLADLYSWWRGGYRNLMIRIQRFIVGLKNHDRKLREEEKEKEDPLEKEEREGMHTKKAGVCRPGGRDKVPEYDSSPPDVVRNKGEAHRSHKGTHLLGKHKVASRRRRRNRRNTLAGTVPLICEAWW